MKLDSPRTVRWLAAAAIAVLLFAAALLYRSTSERTITLRISAGDPQGRRHELAEHLEQLAVPLRLRLEIVPTAGSEDALERLSRGELDIALIQGGLPQPENVTQVASLIDEPLHLLVKKELLSAGIPGLKGKRINLGPEGRGTRLTAQEVLAAVDLRPEDYIDEQLGYVELSGLSPEKLPDAVFIVSSLPSPNVKRLVDHGGYRLMELPVGNALETRDRSLKDSLIPAFTYGFTPAVPERPVHTPATRLMLAARKGVPTESVTRLMEAVFETDFALRADLPPLRADDVQKHREYPLHSGAVRYLNRNQPLIDGEFVEGIENLRSFLFSALVGLFLLWRWSVRRQAVGFERYLDRVSQIEAELLKLRSSEWTPGRLQTAHRQLTAIKQEALAEFCSGRLSDDEHLQSLLLHVADVRRELAEMGTPVET